MSATVDAAGAPAPPSKKELERERVRFQKRWAEIARVWTGWLDFERPLREKEPEYLERLNQLVRQISQEKQNALDVDMQRIGWDEARNRVLTIERLEMLAQRYGKLHRQIQSDVGKVANHNGWMSRLNGNGEYRILNDVKLGMVRPSDAPKPIVVKPHAPMMLTASQVNRLVAQKNAEFEESTKAFLGGDPPVPKTAHFDFVEGMERQLWHSERDGPRPKRPRKNWRREL